MLPRYFLPLAVFAGACSAAPKPAPLTNEPPPQAAPVVPEPPVRHDPTERWREFLVERFAAEPQQTLHGDFNQDGQPDVAIVIGDALLVFHDVFAETPQTWVNVSVAPQNASPKVVSEGGVDRIVIGDAAPIVIAYADGSYHWTQQLPAEFADAIVDAGTRVKCCDLSQPHRSFSDKRWDVKHNTLVDWFAGDFDADGDIELAVISAPAKTALLYEAGSSTPTVETMDYPAGIGIVHKNERNQISRYPDDEATQPQHVEITGDYLELAVPEASAIVLFRKDGAWRKVWIAD